MDRTIVYSGALPQTTDILNTNKFGQIGLGFMLRGILGGTTVVHNLSCTPTSPASLQVVVGAGAIYTLDTTDATAYSDLGLDQHQIIKQGINPDPITLSITPPGTPGQSQVYLVQAILSDIDTGLAVLPYYNATNPSMPFSGPANNGMSQYTTRGVVCTIGLKAGVAAATGSQVTPSPDAGWTGLYAVTVANGQTQITTVGIVLLPTAPFFPTLPSVPNGVQTNLWTYCVDTGAVNAMAATIYPPVTSLVPGTGVLLKVLNGNTSTATFNLNGLGAQAVHRANGSNLSSGDINAGELLALVWDGSAWQTLNFFGFTATTTNNNTFTLSIPWAVDSGSVNAMTGLFSPALTSLVAGQMVEIQASNTNTGDTSIVCNALAAKLLRQNGAVLQPRAVVSGQILTLIYDGTFFQIVNARWPYYSFDTSAPPGTDVSMAIGDQVTVTFSNAIGVPLRVACVQGVYEIIVVIHHSTTGPGGPNTTGGDNDLALLANNTQYAPIDPGFWNFVTQPSDQGGAANAFPFLSTNTVSEAWKDNYGQGWSAGLEATGMFSTDLFDNSVNYSFMGATAYNQGPMMVRILCSTFTAAKMVQWFGCIAGGASIGFSRWYDTSIAWTSLGTFTVTCNWLGPTFQQFTISGVATVKRLA